MQTSLLYLFTLCFAFFNCGDSTSEAQQPSTEKTQFRAATYNIRYDADADKQSGNGWDVRKGALSGVIRNHQFDVFGTQEGHANQLADLKGMLPGFDYVGYPYGGKGDLHNCATFYRTALFEVLDSGVFWFSETPDEPSIGWDATDRRICNWTKFKVKETGKEFFFFNVHFYWRLEVAKRESGPVLVRKVKEIAGEAPAICVGDFNSTVETSQIKAIKTLLHDAYDRSKTPPQGVENTNLGGGIFQGEPKNRIDYIFLTPHFEVENYKVISDVYNDNHYPSDHLPVTSLLTF
ncbi:endonuclease/exonuclease/phosphatase family protein [Parapedobacter defluvii]|uniref:endonuclease/exonuclease/phosphatase family protein n=1 Tax=Parapedobacter defluvii TaxID=2045106 RepID=UPI00334144B3